MRAVDVAVGQQIRAALDCKQMTIEAVANAISVTPLDLQAYCDGAVRAPAEVLCDLAVFLNVRVEDFFATVPAIELDGQKNGNAAK
jgi:transcriptional regulator with XRE-family HTH domain